HWDYQLLREMIYDANIEINFLNHPQLDDAAEQDEFLLYLTELLKRLPDHIVSHILTGYIYKSKGEMSKRDGHYQTAFKLFSDNGLNKTFAKYLDWDYKSIRDFNRYLKEKQLTIPGNSKNLGELVN
ncbi:hypothetical protein ACFLRB_05195, partial [Acidobacteriota bacterium]